MPDVSVIIPTYNRLWSLPEAVESCRHDACNVEIIVVDDGSTDGTGEWLRSQKDVVAIRSSNWGKDWAVNSGVQLARGQYIRFLDSDDWLIAGANDAQVETAREYAADVIAAAHFTQDDRVVKKHEPPWVHCDDFIAQQLGECDSSHYSAYLFRKEFVRGIPHRQEFGAYDDRMYVIEVALQKPRVAIHPRPTFVHRHHAQERLQFRPGTRGIATNLSQLEIYKKALAILEQRGELTLRRKRAAIRVLWPLAHSIARTHLDEACKVVEWIGALDPEFVPPNDGILGKCYQSLGFVGTEKLLGARRSLIRLIFG